MIASRRQRPTRRTAIGALLGAGIGAVCGRDLPAGLNDPSVLDDAAEQYVRLTLELGQHQPSLVEAWNGPVDLSPGPRRPVATIRDRIDALHTRLGQMGNGAGRSPRIGYLAGQVAALSVAARRLSGESMTFADEARAALALAPSTWRAGADTLAGVREQLHDLLPGRGALHERVGALRRGHAVELARVEAALTAAVDACRERVAKWVSLPRDERVTISRAAGVGAEARATRTASLITNVRLDEHATPDVAHLVWLAAHETYAGHHLQHVLAESEAVAAIERRLQPAFGPHLLYAEGAAEAGASLLLEGASFAEMCEHVCQIAGVAAAGIDDLIAVHRAMRTLDIVIPQVAEAYLDGAIGQAEAVERLAEEGLVPDAASFLGVIERQRTRVLAYPVGRRLVTQALVGRSPEQRWQRLRSISTTLTVE